MKKIIAAILVLCAFVYGATSCGGHTGDNGGQTPTDSIAAALADTIANPPSVVKGDSLPADYKTKPVTAPIRKVRTVKNPVDSLAPEIICDRLSIIFTDPNTDLNAFVKDFKRLYPKKEYKVISFDDQLKMMEISIPEDVRDLMANGLNAQMPNYSFIINVESVYRQQSLSGERCPNAGWHINAIGLKEAWKETKGSAKVVVAVVDNGFDLNHEMYADRIVSPHNVVTNDANAWNDNEGQRHGTHVAALAVGSDMYVEEGVTGVAPQCKLMPIKVFDGELCSDYSIINGVMYAIMNKADVLNLSVGIQFPRIASLLTEEEQRFLSSHILSKEQETYEYLFSLAASLNCVIVTSAGNDHMLSSMDPKHRTGKAIVVCATDINNAATDFTNYGDGSTISAPGEGIYSAMPNNRYGCLDGTSMAAPIVTGMVALLKSKEPNITYSQICSRLKSSGKSTRGDIPSLAMVDKLLKTDVDSPLAMVDKLQKTDVDIETFTVKGVTFKMVKVDGGSFMMGCLSSQEAEAFDDEKSLHRVTLSSYYIGQTEVTQALWQAVMGKSLTQIENENGWKMYGVGSNYPMYGISWDDVQIFLHKLNALTGRTFRLPTEAQWEFAARGGNKSKGYKYAGSNNLGAVAWFGQWNGETYDNGNSGEHTHSVATKQPNELGIYDMSGNVWEWCQDWYDDYTQASVTNPKGPSSGSDRVLRGGSWGRNAQYCHSSYRGSGGPGDRFSDIGLRLVLFPD